MTIVYTEKGSEIINDGLVESIKFDRKEQKVYVIPANAPREPPREITCVQQVIYNVQAEPRTFSDSCQEILNLRNAIHEQSEKYNELIKYTDRMRAFVFKLQDKNPELWDVIASEVRQERPKLFDNEQDQSKPSDKSA